MPKEKPVSESAPPTPVSVTTPLQIRNLTLPNRAFLAPLAGVSDVPFRRICQEHGAGLTYVEMLSATALVHGSKKTFDMFRRHPSESVLGVQVTGHTVEVVEQACRILHGEGFDTIDINMGCPVKKIVSSGCGSAILKDPQRVENTLKACRSITDRAFSAKIRLGYTRDTVNVSEISEIIAAAGCDQISIHGRTRSENYATPVDLQGISQGFAAARRQNKQIACVSNGDVFGPQDVTRHMELSGADAVMVSRGALGNPWIFRQILEGSAREPTIEEWEEAVLRHLEYHLAHYGDTKVGALLMRKHLLWYIKGFPGSKGLRDIVNQVSTLGEAAQAIRDFAHKVPSGFQRYSSEWPRGISKEKVDRQADPKFEMDRKLDQGVGDDQLPAAPL